MGGSSQLTSAHGGVCSCDSEVMCPKILPFDSHRMRRRRESRPSASPLMSSKWAVSDNPSRDRARYSRGPCQQADSEQYHRMVTSFTVVTLSGLLARRVPTAPTSPRRARLPPRLREDERDSDVCTVAETEGRHPRDVVESFRCWTATADTGLTRAAVRYTPGVWLARQAY